MLQRINHFVATPANQVILRVNSKDETSEGSRFFPLFKYLSVKTNCMPLDPAHKCKRLLISDILCYCYSNNQIIIQAFSCYSKPKKRIL